MRRIFEEIYKDQSLFLKFEIGSLSRVATWSYQHKQLLLEKNHPKWKERNKDISWLPLKYYELLPQANTMIGVFKGIYHLPFKKFK